jgi:hypothetical protein
VKDALYKCDFNRLLREVRLITAETKNLDVASKSNAQYSMKADLEEKKEAANDVGKQMSELMAIMVKQMGEMSTRLESMEHRIVSNTREKPHKSATAKPKEKNNNQENNNSNPLAQKDKKTSEEQEAKGNSASGSNYFCYNCGQDKHTSRYCRNAPNQALVVQKFILLQKDKGHLN